MQKAKNRSLKETAQMPPSRSMFADILLDMPQSLAPAPIEATAGEESFS